EIALRVGCDPAGELRQPISRHRLKTQRLGVLVLTARSFQIDNQIARYPKGGFAPQVFLDQSKSEIDPCCYSRRSVEIAVTNEESIGLDAQIWKTPRDIGRKPPMRRHSPAIEQTCRGQCVDAGTD